CRTVHVHLEHEEGCVRHSHHQSHGMGRGRKLEFGEHHRNQIGNRGCHRIDIDRRPRGSHDHPRGLIPCQNRWVHLERVLIALCLLSQAHAATLSKVVDKNGPIRSETITLPSLTASAQYSLLYSAAALSADARIVVEIHQGAAILGTKTLHAG